MSRFFQPRTLNIPNAITMSRLVAIPVLVIVLMALPWDRGDWSATLSLVAAIIFAFASLSDVVDGYLARRFKAISTFGKFFDPFADKLLVLSALIMLIPLGRMPAWIVVVLLIREVSITMLRGVAANEHIIITSSQWGKYKNSYLSTGLVGILMHHPFLGIHWREIGWVLYMLGVLFAVGSGIDYVVAFVKEIKRQPAARAKL